MKRKIAVISDHASPLVSLRTTDRDVEQTEIICVAQNLVQMGYQVDIFTRQDHDEIAEVCDWLENIRVVRVPVRHAEHRKQDSLWGDKRDFADHLIEIFNRQEKSYDLIHADFHNSGLAAARIKAAVGTPFVVSFHMLSGGGRAQKNSDLSLVKPLEIEERVLREAAGIIVGSQQDKDDLIALYNANPMYIVQIPWATGLVHEWAMDTGQEQKCIDDPEQEHSIAKALPDGQTIAAMLAEFYEDVLAVRRIAITEMDSLLWPIHSEAHPNQIQILEQTFETAIQMLQETRLTLGKHILDAARMMTASLQRGGRIMVCGNGRSAAYAQHFAAELAGDFIIPGGAGLPVLCLTTEPASLAAWSKDIAYEQVFAMQVETLGRPGDLLVGISAGEDSANLVQAFRLARANDIACLVLVGPEGGDLPSLSDVALVVSGGGARRVQDVQMLVLHLLCDLVEERMQGGPRCLAESFYDATHAIRLLDN